MWAKVLCVCALLCALLVPCIAPNPGLSVTILGVHVDTYPLVDRLTHALFADYDREFGRAVHFKPNGGCLDANSKCGPDYYCPFVTRACNPASATQQWRLTDHYLEVATKAVLNEIGVQASAPCLDCALAKSDCFLDVCRCNALPNQKFELRVHAAQIDLAHRRIFFAVHSQLFDTKCLTHFFNTTNNLDMFRLQECEGTDEQSFYLDLDFTKELDEIRAKVVPKQKR